MNEVVVGHKANPKLLSYVLFFLATRLTFSRLCLRCPRRWRAPSNKLGRSDSTDMYGFIDGDFVERYLGYSADSIEVKKILEGRNQSERLPQSEAEIRAFIQHLQRA